MLRILWNINTHGFILGQRYCFFLRCANLATKKRGSKNLFFHLLPNQDSNPDRQNQKL